MDKKEIRVTVKRFKSDLFYRKTYIKVHLPDDKEFIVHSELELDSLLGLVRCLLDGELKIDEDFYESGTEVKECRVIIH